ncbi:hypothetical protein E3983_01190 [Legionella israelensis]|uniref:Uncharacterized protein n=1 Tax=Legionella israelensis TaxID=454 RepID=A0AAX1EDH8_9GAMM|nr:hypothetical protein [Legionella israelensis]QBR83092.1 hypothetical protein E3983_01190 [Legionella israelensis]
MTRTNRFFKKSSNDRRIYNKVSTEFNSDIKHIQNSYTEILNDEKNIRLLNEMEELNNKMDELFENFFKKDEKDVMKDICVLKTNILQLKTKCMIQYLLSHNDEYGLEDYNRVATSLHNPLEDLSSRIFPIKWGEFNLDSDTYIAINYGLFEEGYSILRARYDACVIAFSIGDLFDDWSYDEDDSSDNSVALQV